MLLDKSNQKILATGVGRRKSAVAIVQVYKSPLPDKHIIYINNREIEVFLQFNPIYLSLIKLSLNLLNLNTNFKILVKTRGGGIGGQADAISLGLARALCKIDPSYRTILKTAGLLRRDSRIVERKKYGLKKARKASQYSKR